MTEYKDRSGIRRHVEFSPSFKEGWIKLTISSPDKKTYGDSIEIPVGQLEEIIENATNLIEENK